MDVRENPRPGHRLTRCCGNCKFYISKHALSRIGACILPEGPKMSSEPKSVLKQKINQFDPTHIQCVCDNHQWKPKGFLKNAAKVAKVSLNDIR